MSSKSTPLPEVLAQLIGVARGREDGTARTRLPGGLFLAVKVRQEAITLSAWRTRSKLPSRKECEIVARDAGLLEPSYRTFERKDGITAFVITGTTAQTETAKHVPEEPAVQASTPSTPEARREHHLRVLLLCCLINGLRVPWFRRPEAQDARQSYLRGLSLAELLEERRSRYGRWQLAVSRRWVQVLASWRLRYRALPGVRA